MHQNELYYSSEKQRNEVMRRYQSEGFTIVSSGDFLGPDDRRLYWFRYL